jgi:hypothetical protein
MHVDASRHRHCADRLTCCVRLCPCSGAGALAYSHVVMFEEQARVVSSWMAARGCRVQLRLFNSHFSNGHDLQQAVWLWECELW